VVEDLARARVALPARLTAHEIEVQRMEPIPPSLEDVFVALVHAQGGAPVD